MNNPESNSRVLPPSQQMMQLIWPGALISQAIYVAAELGVADILANGPQAMEHLARETKSHEPTLRRLLRSLIGIGIFSEDSEGRLHHTPLSETLIAEKPASLRPWAMMLGSPFIWKTWGALRTAVDTGKPSFDDQFGVSFFDYLANQPKDASVFSSAMTSGSSMAHAAILEAYDFSGFERVVDVGGGQGRLLQAILSASPGVHGILFDRSSVVAGASVLQKEPFASRCQVIGGDFFREVPEGADGYVMRMVLHDWNDEKALQILRNCRRSIRAEGRLMLVEMVLRPTPEPDPARFMDLFMLSLLNGKERTEQEFRVLLEEAGFSLQRVIPTQGPASVLECRPI